MAETVKKHRAHIGIALDGDADRCIICDENGNFIDGDKLIGIIAKRYHKKELLTSDYIIGTQMSNLGLDFFLEEIGLKLFRSNVGDRYVVEAMRKYNSNLGGEQSGHIIIGKHGTTGDGLVASLQIIAEMVEQNIKASTLFKNFKLLPQLTENIKFNNKKSINIKDDFITDKIKIAESLLGEHGRILIRKSGTENKLRIMGECKKRKVLLSVIKNLKTEITNYLND